jgi:hypothetical protein
VLFFWEGVILKNNEAKQGNSWGHIWPSRLIPDAVKRSQSKCLVMPANAGIQQPPM